MRHAALCWSLLVAAACAAPSNDKRQFPSFPNPFAPAPSVTIRNGTVVGKTSNGVDSFLGIPFAQPPVGQLRLKPPTPITKGFGTIQATSTPTACPQMASYINGSTTAGQLQNQFSNPAFKPGTGPQGENCLTLNVQRPSTASSKKLLPVLFWIYGGGFEFGSTQTYDGSPIVSKSTSLQADVVYVAVNYRVSGFGFLAGKELQRDGSTNLGLRDQRLALKWVKENIAAFGGDPDRVTIWGESAGSISVFDHLLINNGDNTYLGRPLFIGAIMDSGTAVPTSPVNAAKPQAVYDAVVAAGGCSRATDTLACLRGLSFADFNNACNVVPEQAASSGAVAKVPIIVGDQEDEGTLFSVQLNNVTSTDLLVQYLTPYFPDASQADIRGLVNTYPTDPAAGSPFNTGAMNEIYPGYKRNAALLGDITFTITRRIVLAYKQQLAPTIPAWSYLSSYFSGTPVLGTFHGTDIVQAYAGLPYPNVQSSILTYYISFVNFLDPNAIAGQLAWPKWDASKPQLLHFKQTGNDLVADTFRPDTYNYLVAHQAVFHV